MASPFGTRVICSRNVLQLQSIRSLRCSTLFNGGKRLTDPTNLEITPLSETSQSQNCYPTPPSCKCTMQHPFQALMGQAFTRFNSYFKKQKGCKVGQRQVTTETYDHRDQLCAQLTGDLICKRCRQIEHINVVDNPWHPCVAITRARESCARSTIPSELQESGSWKPAHLTRKPVPWILLLQSNFQKSCLHTRQLPYMLNALCSTHLGLEDKEQKCT